MFTRYDFLVILILIGLFAMEWRVLDNQAAGKSFRSTMTEKFSETHENNGMLREICKNLKLQVPPIHQ